MAIKSNMGNSCIIMEMSYSQTVSVSIFWLCYGVLVLQDVTIWRMGKAYIETLCNIPYKCVYLKIVQLKKSFFSDSNVNTRLRTTVNLTVSTNSNCLLNTETGRTVRCHLLSSWSCHLTSSKIISK